MMTKEISMIGRLQSKSDKPDRPDKSEKSDSLIIRKSDVSGISDLSEI